MRNVSALLLATLGCAPAGARVTSPRPPAPVLVVRPSEAQPAAKPAEIAIRLRVQFEPRAEVHVEIELDRPGNTLVIDDPVAAAWHIESLHDDDGEVAYEVEDAARRRLHLQRATRGRLHLAYRLEAPAVSSSGAIEPRLYVDPAADLVRLRAESVLWLPTDGREASYTLDIDAPQERVATTLGLGAHADGSASADALRHVDVIIGDLARAWFRTPEAHDEAAALGPGGFDPRWVAAETAGVRTAIGQYFQVHEEGRFTFLLFGRRTLNASAHAVTLRTGGAVAEIASWATWDASARLAVAHVLAHRFVGARMRVHVSDVAAEGVWFAQGFSRHVGREVLFGLGLLPDEDLLAEVNAMEAMLATSRWGRESNAQVVTHPEAEAARLVAARGTLYAARLRSVIAARGQQRTLEGLLAGLLTHAREHGPDIDLAVWEQAITEYAGAAEVEAFRAFVLRGEAMVLPNDAFGPCFRPTRGRYLEYALGFVDPGFRGEPVVVTDVVLRGPAHVAGLRDGDTLVDLSYRPDDSAVPVLAVVRRAAGEVELRWSPRGAEHKGRAWIRDRRVPDHACVP